MKLRPYQENVRHKICSKCGISKELNEFIFNNKKNRHVSRCKECDKKYKKEYYQKNKDGKIKEYNEKNRERILKNKKISKEKNIDAVKEYQKKWYNENKKHVLRYNKKYTKEKKINDPEYKLKNDIRKNFDSAFKRTLNRKTKSFFSYTNIAIAEYIGHLKKEKLWEEYENGGNIHIDHILPVAAFDFNDEKEIAKCYNPKNLRLLFAKDNIEKSDKIDWNLIHEYNLYDLLPKSILLEGCKIEKRT